MKYENSHFEFDLAQHITLVIQHARHTMLFLGVSQDYHSTGNLIFCLQEKIVSKGNDIPMQYGM